MCIRDSNYGAGEHKRVKKIYRIALAMTAFIMVLGTVLSLLIPDRLMGLFSENADTVRAGAEALRIISIGFIVSSVSVTTSGLWKTQPHFPKILRSGSKHRLQEIPFRYAGGLKTALHKYDNQSS